MSASSVKPLNVQLPAITLILFALCVGIFCYLAQWMSYEEVDQSALIHLGANVASLTLSGESWRLLSSVFLHSSVSHLLMNMFALLVVEMCIRDRWSCFQYGYKCSVDVVFQIRIA